MLQIAKIVCFAINFFVIGTTVARPITAEQYEAVRSLVVPILSSYDPSTHVMVGIGASPDPVVALFEVLGVPASAVPISFRSDGLLARFHSDRDFRELLFRHFDEFIPQGSKDKSIVFLDYTGTGRTLNNAVPIFDEYCANRGWPPPTYLGIYAWGAPKGLNPRVRPFYGFRLGKEMLGFTFKRYRRYPRWDPMHPYLKKPKKVDSEEYLAMKASFEKFVASDPKPLLKQSRCPQTFKSLADPPHGPVPSPKGS